MNLLGLLAVIIICITTILTIWILCIYEKESIKSKALVNEYREINWKQELKIDDLKIEITELKIKLKEENNEQNI